MNHEGKIIPGQPVYLREHETTRSVRLSQQNPSSSNYRLRKLSVAILILCATVWLWQKIANPHTFPIHNVQISGSYGHVNRAQLQQTILPYLQKGFISIDTAGLLDNLQQLPWVNTVTIKRVWPDKLKIVLQEQQPAARFGSTDLINKQGDRFTVDAATIPAGLPLLLGEQGQEKLMLNNYDQMMAILAPLGLRIVTLSLNARESWSLQLSNGIVLLIGRTDPITRLQRFVKVYPQIVGNKIKQIYSIDLRYTNGVAVRYQ